MNALERYQVKAKAVIDDILAGNDYSEKEIIILASAMQIAQYQGDCLICDELSSAEMYLKKYHDSGDAEYLDFARDEMKHAQKPLTALKARLHYATPKEIEMYNWAIERAKKIEPMLVNSK